MTCRILEWMILSLLLQIGYIWKHTKSSALTNIDHNLWFWKSSYMKIQEFYLHISSENPDFKEASNQEFITVFN